MKMNIAIMEGVFWMGLFIIFYAYLGYGIILYGLVILKRMKAKKEMALSEEFTPEVTLIVPCYNEKEFIIDKIKNCLELDYPKDRLKLCFITDGSTDGTQEIIRSKFPEVQLLHEPKRGGKSAAENRSMKFVKTPFVIFSDANTLLPVHAVKDLVKHYQDPKVGAVSGEKRIVNKRKDNATGAGEGIYWKYESKLKALDSELLTIVGAAGELFSFRTELFEELEEDTILDDFMLSMRIAEKNYKVVYEPEAYAMETASENVKEELKRKIRICAGGWQSMIRLKGALNFSKHPLLTFQYISHRVLRWSIAPLMLLLVFPLSIALFEQGIIYEYLFYAQTIFYMAAMIGWYLENQRIKIKPLFIPYYFFIMNYAVLAGFVRYLTGKQSAAWDRSKRGVAVS